MYAFLQKQVHKIQKTIYAHGSAINHHSKNVSLESQVGKMGMKINSLGMDKVKYHYLQTMLSCLLWLLKITLTHVFPQKLKQIHMNK